MKKIKYILYSPQHEQKVEGFTKPNGETVPDRVFTIHARALYMHKKFPDRRYRRDYPDDEKDLKLLQCRTITQAIEEQKRLQAYSGEVFEIRAYHQGRIGEMKQ